MALRNRRNAPTTRPPKDPRAALAHDLQEGGQIVASACGTCGGTVPDEPRAVQEWIEGRGKWPFVERVRSWRVHGGCATTLSEVLLARVLDPQASPIRVDQATYDVSRARELRLAYRSRPRVSPGDRGGAPWHHISGKERRELAEAVERRRAELVEAARPAQHPSHRPCQVCGTSHEIPARWTVHRDLPVCGSCTVMVQRAQIPGNFPLAHYAMQAASSHLHHRARFALAREVADYRPLQADERRAPWAYTAGLPLSPPSEEERLAELERRLEARLAEVSA